MGGVYLCVCVYSDLALAIYLWIDIYIYVKGEESKRCLMWSATCSARGHQGGSWFIF